MKSLEIKLKADLNRLMFGGRPLEINLRELEFGCPRCKFMSSYGITHLSLSLYFGDKCWHVARQVLGWKGMWSEGTTSKQ